MTPWFAAVGALSAPARGGLCAGRRRLAPRGLAGLGIPLGGDPAPEALSTPRWSPGFRTWSAGWSSVLLDALGVFHVMDGNVVEVGGRELLVDQACSGIYSLFTLLAGTLFYVFWCEDPAPAWSLALMVASVFWVLFGNVVRIVGVVAISTYLGIDAASGWRHELIGLMTFALMLAMVVSTDRLLAFAGSLVAVAREALSREGRRGDGGPHPGKRRRRAVRCSGRRGRPGAVGTVTRRRGRPWPVRRSRPWRSPPSRVPVPVAARPCPSLRRLNPRWQRARRRAAPNWRRSAGPGWARGTSPRPSGSS